jgi:D-glycero-D-manno-heptose 1,7-bisphosphate phosphatase
MRLVDWVFLDRDGTINAKAPDGEYVRTPAELRLLPGAASAIRRLNEAGIWVGLVTNQRGIALGKMTEQDFALIQHSLAEQLAKNGAHIDSVYHCPHDIDECECRKPAPGMLLNARREVPGLDFGRAAIVGDSRADVDAGRAVGAVTVLVGDAPDASRVEPRPDHLAPSLEGAVEWLLSEPSRSDEPELSPQKVG